jgi:CrcB protein
MAILLIAAGGAAGAVSRYLVDGWVAERLGTSFPWGTLVVNLSGSFLLGLLFAVAIESAALPSAIRGPVMIGFIGAYTTFSTLALESWRLLEDGAVILGLANAFGSIAVGLVAVVLGLVAGRVLA